MYLILVCIFYCIFSKISYILTCWKIVKKKKTSIIISLILSAPCVVVNIYIFGIESWFNHVLNLLIIPFSAICADMGFTDAKIRITEKEKRLCRSDMEWQIAEMTNDAMETINDSIKSPKNPHKSVGKASCNLEDVSISKKAHSGVLCATELLPQDNATDNISNIAENISDIDVNPDGVADAINSLLDACINQ